MFTSFTKKMMLTFALTTLVVGSVAFSGDTKAPSTVRASGGTVSTPSMGSDGKLYNQYSGTQTAEMLDAIDRDHPVAATGKDMNPDYASYKKRGSTTLLNAVDRDNPVLTTGQPIVKDSGSYKNRVSEEIVDIIDHNRD